MGFTCFVCQEPFNEKLSILDGVGGGDGQIERAVSVTKCGHLFHTECLKQIFAAECVNVWSAKSCPVCKQVLNMVNDVFRVHACPFEANSAQYARLEELQNQNDKLQHENHDLKQRIDHLFRQHNELQCNLENLMREKDGLAHCNDQFRRINSINSNEIDRQKHEIEKLRNIIITLSEKFTGSGVNDNSNLGGNTLPLPRIGTINDGHFTRKEYPYSVLPPFNGNTNYNGLFKHTHPPGLGFPPRSETGSESCTSRTSPQQSHTAISISPPESVSEPNYSAIRNSNAQLTISGFSFNDFSPMEYENGFKEKFDTFHSLKSSIEQSVATPTVSKVVSKPGITSKSPPAKEAAQSNLTVKPESASKIKDNVELENKDLNRNIAIGNFLDDLFAVGKKDESCESDSSGKWHETKSRRRSQSKCSISKSDVSDKKLYGSFACPTCKAKWGSSHSFMDTPQTCRYCKTEVHPHSQGPILSRKQLDLFKQTEKPSKKKQLQ